MVTDDRSYSNLRNRLLGGTFWVGASQLAVQGAQFVGLLILVRLLSPEDFGLVAMCFVVMGVTAIFIEMGLPNALIQARELTAVQRSSASWVCFGLAAPMAGVVILAAPLVSSLFKEPRIVGLLRVFSLGFIINALAVVPDAILRRDIRFKEVAADDDYYLISFKRHCFDSRPVVRSAWGERLPGGPAMLAADLVDNRRV